MVRVLYKSEELEVKQPFLTPHPLSQISFFVVLKKKRSE